MSSKTLKKYIKKKGKKNRKVKKTRKNVVGGKRKTNKGGNKPTDNKVTVVYIFAKWCHFCKAFKDTWNDIKNSNSGKVTFMEVELDNFDSSSLNGLITKPTHVPYLVKLSNATANDEFSGNITMNNKDSIQSWIDT